MRQMQTQKKLAREKWVWPAMAGLVLLCVAGGWLALAMLRQHASPAPSQASVQQNVNAQRSRGDATSATLLINDALANSATPPDVKFDLYIQQGAIAEEANNWPAAAASYENAVALRHTAAVYTLLGRAYAHAGNTAKAIAAYKSAIPLVPASDAQKESDMQSLQQSITALGGQP